MKADVLIKLLEKTQYDKKESQFLYAGFKRGFSLQYRGPMDRKDTSRNIPFTPGVGNSIEMWNKIMKEVAHKRFAGPFNSIPFEYYVQSPIGLVPKAGNQTRVIFHLSYDFPNGNQSINAWTPKECCTVRYNDLDHAVKNALFFINQFKDSQVFQTLYFGISDLKSAFRQVPLSSQMWPLLILKAVNPSTGTTQYFVDKCLPFGASISCSHFQRLSNAIRHIVVVLEKAYHSITNYLDDYLFLHYLKKRCEEIMNTFFQICNKIGIPIALEKTELPRPQMTFLGMLLNGITYTMMIPESKVNKALFMLEKACYKKKLTIKEIESLTGTLNFLNRAIVPGRVFTHRMYSALEGKITNRNNQPLKPHHHVSLNLEFRNDCEVWKNFLMYQRAGPFWIFQSKQVTWTSGSTQMQANPKNLGFGCLLQKEWTFGQWEPNFIELADPSIAYLELYALTVGILVWKERLQNIKILIHCDNSSVVEMVNKMTSKCKNCMYLLRILILDNLIHNRSIRVQYISTKDNFLADALSRLKIKKFLQLAPAGTKSNPEELPREIWPISRIYQS